MAPTLVLDDWVDPPPSVDAELVEFEGPEEVEEVGGELVDEAVEVEPPAEDSGALASASA
jgi:hypothetical protein